MPEHTIFELRNYLLHPGQRDVLIDMFERDFIESQEAVGICIAATFRNLDDPDRFVWIRGFPDYEARANELGAFYFGPVWQSHRTAANATIVDSDRVLLLRPHSGRLRCGGDRPAIGATALPPTIFAVATYYLAPGGEEEFAHFFEREIDPAIRRAGGAMLATFVSEHRPNNFPRLPVRENLNVFVSVSRFASLEQQSASAQAIGALGGEIGRRVAQPTETLRLQPTARSLLR